MNITINKKMFKKMPVAAAIGLATVVLFGCGGSGSGYESKNDSFNGSELSKPISGFVVDDLVANAKLTLYKLDTSKKDWLGEALATGITDDSGKIKDLVLPPFTANQTAFLLVSEGGTMLNGNNPPLAKMTTVVTADDIIQGKFSYVTPLSTFAVEYSQEYYANDSVGLNADLEKNLLRDRQAEVKDRFGLGVLEPSVNLFSDPVLVDEAIESQKSSDGVVNATGKLAAQAALNLRMANNALLALVNDVKELGATGSFGDVLQSVAQDQVDGKPDLRVNGVQIASLGVDETAYFNALNVTADNIANLDVPGGQGTVGETLSSFTSADNAKTYSLVTPGSSDLKAVVPGDDTAKEGCIKGVNGDGQPYPCLANNLPDISQLPATFSVIIGNNEKSVLDSSAVTDADKEDTLVYSWVLKTPAAGSTCVTGGTGCFSDATIVNPVFAADVTGDYVVTYTISDGYSSQEQDVTVKAVTQAQADANTPPVISITGESRTVGADKVVDETNLATAPVSFSSKGLTVAVTDANSDPVTNAWVCHFNRFAYIDAGDSYAGLANEAVTLTGATTLDPSFTPIPFEGVYTCTLTSKDDQGGESMATVKFVYDKSGPSAAYMFGIGAVALVLIGFFRRRK